MGPGSGVAYGPRNSEGSDATVSARGPHSAWTLEIDVRPFLPCADQRAGFRHVTGYRSMELPGAGLANHWAPRAPGTLPARWDTGTIESAGSCGLRPRTANHPSTSLPPWGSYRAPGLPVTRILLAIRHKSKNREDVNSRLVRKRPRIRCGTTLRTGRPGECLWQARERGGHQGACRLLGRTHAMFETAERQCDGLARE